MFDLIKIKHLKKYIDSLSIKYDMFYSNREYKNVHFKSEDEYILIQKNLSTEIEITEKDITKIIKEWFYQNFEKVEFIAYDSRFICISPKTHRIGKVLLKNVIDENFRKNIKQKFNDDTNFDIIIESFEDLPEELQKKFTF